MYVITNLMVPLLGQCTPVSFKSVLPAMEDHQWVKFHCCTGKLVQSFIKIRNLGLFLFFFNQNGLSKYIIIFYTVVIAQMTPSIFFGLRLNTFTSFGLSSQACWFTLDSSWSTSFQHESSKECANLHMTLPGCTDRLFHLLCRCW